MLYFLFTISQQLELLAYTKYSVPDSESCDATHLPGTRWLLPCKLVPPYRCGIYVCRCAGTSSSSPQGKWRLPWMNGTAWWPSFFLLWLTSCSGNRKQPQRVNNKNDNKKQNNGGQVNPNRETFGDPSNSPAGRTGSVRLCWPDVYRIV